MHMEDTSTFFAILTHFFSSDPVFLGSSLSFPNHPAVCSSSLHPAVSFNNPVAFITTYRCLTHCAASVHQAYKESKGQSVWFILSHITMTYCMYNWRAFHHCKWSKAQAHSFNGQVRSHIHILTCAALTQRAHQTHQTIVYCDIAQYTVSYQVFKGGILE